jgi:ketosteroid isomerase-like protein
MKKLMMCLLVALIPLSALAAHHESVETKIQALVEAFNGAYATNDLETYFGYYTDDAALYFFGARQPVATYREEYGATVADGGGYEKYDLSDMRVQVMPGDSVAIATYFVDATSRSPDGKLAPLRAFETDIWQKIGGEWRIVNMHYSDIPAEE